MQKGNHSDIILRPGKPRRPGAGWFPFSFGRGKEERESLTVGPYQVGIVIWDGMVLEIFSGDTRPLPKGEVQTYIASTAPFNLTYWLKVPWEFSTPNDLILDPPLMTSDGQHVVGRVDLTLSVTTEGVGETLSALGDSDEGAHRLLQLLGPYGEVITKSDVADMVKGELLPKLLALDFRGHAADELLSNRTLLRDIAGSLETELALVTDRFGLRLVNLYPNWDIGDRSPKRGRGLPSTAVQLDTVGCSGPTPLHQAVRDGQTETALALVSAGADIHARDENGIAPLHEAAGKGNTEVALALVSAGADIDARAINGMTPLYAAASMGNTEVALALFSAGADIHARTDNGSTPLHVAVTLGQTQTLLDLVHAGADIDARGPGGMTPLHGAAGMGQVLTVLHLTSVGADVHARTDDSMTPLHTAAAQDQTESARALVAAGADIHARTDGGITPLHLAAFGGYTETALALVTSGADIYATDNDGITPLLTAVGRGDAEMVQMFTEGGG